MPYNEFKPSGTTRASQPDAGGGNVKTVPVLGIVKSNIDPIRQGRLQVYIVDPSSSTDPNDSDAWVTVSYMSPFYGRTTPSSGDDGYGKFKNNPSSYGEWHSPPDIGSTVICIFVNGDMNYGYYIGCVPEPEALQMVPAIGATDNIVPNEGEAQSYGGALRLPVTNINTNNEAMADGPNYLREPKPVHSYSAAIMTQQGLIRDPIRGPISTSAQRETPSRVGWGVSTPGRPIYQGGYDDTSVVDNLTPDKATATTVVGRRGGHSFVMDDGDLIGRDQLVRIRSALGHQILMSDDGQTLFIIHANGQSYIELGKEGTIDMFSTNSFNVRTQGDLNLHADNNINIHAVKDLNIGAENINILSDKEYTTKVGTNYKMFTVGQYSTKVSKQMSFLAGADASFASSAITYINGSKINLNTGETSFTPQEVKPIPLVAHTDTLFDDIKGWAAAPGKLLSIVSRAPAHAPWANAGQGVDVKTKSNAKDALPASPSPKLASVNEAAAGALQNGVAAATTATMPATNAVSKALDKNVTNSVVGAVAQAAATGPLAQAVQSGVAVVQQGTQKIAAVGEFAQTPAMLEASGVLKQGSAKLVESLVQSGSTVQKAMTDNLFAGKPGAENLTALVQNTQSQAASVVQNMSTVQNALTNIGAVTGNESATQISGMVMSGLTVGIGPTISAVNNLTATAGGVTGTALNAAASGLTGSAQALLGNATGLAGTAGSALQAIGAGNFAANISQSVTGALGGIQTAVGSLAKITGLQGAIDASRGAAAAAFSAITNSFKPLQANVPQNLSEIAAKAAAATSAAGGQVGQTSTSLASAATNALSGSTGSLTGAINAVSGAVGGAAGSVTGAVAAASGALSNTVAGGASALTNLASTATSSVQNAVGSATNIDSLTSLGLSAAGSEVDSTIASATSGVSASLGSLAGASTILNSATSSLGSLSGAAAGMVGGLSSAASTIASGVSALPGGQGTIANVLNNAPGANNALPGAAALGNLVKNVSSALQNGLPNPGGLLAQAGSLSSLLSAGLPAGAAAQLTSAFSALSSGSSVAIKMPTVALNTFDRSGLTSQITSVLGDKGIPSPNLTGEISPKAKTGAQAQIDKSKEIMNTVKEFEVQREKVAAAREAYQTAARDLPAGDPKIDELKKAWYAAVDSPEYKAAFNKLQELNKTI